MTRLTDLMGRLACTRRLLTLLVFLCHGLSIGINIVLWGGEWADWLSPSLPPPQPMIQLNCHLPYHPSQINMQQFVIGWILMAVLLRMPWLFKKLRNNKSMDTQSVNLRLFQIGRYHAKWNHARATPRLNWTVRPAPRRLRGGGKSGPRSCISSARIATTRHTQRASSPSPQDDDLRRAKEYLQLTPRWEVWRIVWPDPSEWYYCILQSWQSLKEHSPVNRQDFASTGLRDQTRTTASLFLTDVAITSALGRLTDSTRDAAAFYVDQYTCVVPPLLVKSWMDIKDNDSRRKAMDRWRRKRHQQLDRCKEVILVANVNNCHWISVTIDLESCQISYRDTLNPSVRLQPQLVRAAQSLLSSLLDLQSHSSEVPVQKPIALQPNMYDCGLCVIMHIIGCDSEICNSTSLRNLRAWITWVMIEDVVEGVRQTDSPQSAEMSTQSPESSYMLSTPQRTPILDRIASASPGRSSSTPSGHSSRSGSSDQARNADADSLAPSPLEAAVVPNTPNAGVHTTLQGNPGCPQPVRTDNQQSFKVWERIRSKTKHPARRQKPQDTTQRVMTDFWKKGTPEVVPTTASSATCDHDPSVPAVSQADIPVDGAPANAELGSGNDLESLGSANTVSLGPAVTPPPDASAFGPTNSPEAEFEDEWPTPSKPRGKEWTIQSWNVGPTGLAACFTDMLPLLLNRPAAIFLQDVRLMQRDIKRFRRRLADFAPEYELFVNPVSRVTSKGKSTRTFQEVRTAIVMHKGWTYKAGIYDKKNLSNANDKVQMLENILVMHITDPYTHSKGLWINVYNDTAAHPERQSATLDCLKEVIQRLQDAHDYVIIAGDWNASLDTRYARQQAIYPTRPDRSNLQLQSADSKLAQWVKTLDLKVISARNATFSRVHNDLYHATLDYIFVKERANDISVSEAYNLASLEPKHDHKVLTCLVQGMPCSILPTLRTLAPPQRIKRNNWDGKSELWSMSLAPASEVIQDRVGKGEDPLTALDELIQLMQETGKEVLGVTHGSAMPGVMKIPQSAEEKRHRRRVRRYNVALQNIVSLSMSPGGKPTAAMLAVWDEGIRPTSTVPEPFWRSVDPVAHQAVLQEWKLLMREKLAQEKERYMEWERETAAMISTIARDKAIERMDTPGSKEIKRWMGKMGETVVPVYMKTDYPDTIEFNGGELDQELRVKCTSLDIRITNFSTGTQSVRTTKLERIPATHFYDILKECEIHHPRISSSDPNRVVHLDSDKLVAWENFLAKEAQATKTRCCCCSQHSIVPVVKVSEEKREVVKWCTQCCTFSIGVTRPQDYSAHFLKDCLKNKVPPVWRADERLSRSISWEDFLHYVNRLPKRKAPGPDEITAEMLQRAPEAALRVLHEAVNKALSGASDLTTVFKNGNIFLLFKKGDYDDPRNYRPIVLLSLIYKILTAIITDRLNHITEKYNLLDDSQEGFRKLRSTSRQIQSLLWDREDAEARSKALYLVYIDFKNAFNSMDLEAIWAWLELMNVPDVALLQNIYKDTFCQVDTPFGLSAPIFLTRGTKQGDCLSPLLFSLLFNTLLKQLSKMNDEEQLGFLNEMGQRNLHRAFADDLSLMTEDRKKMCRALKVVEIFCDWSGMVVNALKSEASGWDFCRKVRLSTASFHVGGTPLTQLDPAKPYKYLGILCSLTGSFKDEKRHIFSAVKTLEERCKTHPYLTRQIVPVACMLQESWFRYSAAICPWTEAELRDLYTKWVACVKAAWRISRSTASAVFTFPEAYGGKTIRQPKVVMIQALMTHIQQLTNHDDKIFARLVFGWEKIYVNEGSNQETELGSVFSERLNPTTCPLERLLGTCGSLGIAVTLPTFITGLREPKPSWVSVGKILREQDRRIREHVSIDPPFTQAEQTFLSEWTKRTLPCRKVGYADICALHMINGCWMPPSACMTPSDYDTLRNLFARIPVSEHSSASSQNETETIDHWTEHVITDPHVVQGYLIVEQAIDWAIAAAQDSSMTEDCLKSAIEVIAEKILPTPLLDDCGHIEQHYYDCVVPSRQDKLTLVRLLQVAKGMHHARMRKSAKARVRYIDHISYRILRGLPFKPYRILDRKVDNGRTWYEVQWVYSLPLPPSIAYPTKYVGRDTQATWKPADADDDWGDSDLKARLIAEYRDHRNCGRRRPRGDSEETPPPPSKRPVGRRWHSESLSRAIQINRTNVHSSDIQRDQWRCSVKDGIATVSKWIGDFSERILCANQARLIRHFLDPQADLSTWSSWEQHLATLECRGMLLSHQLLHQLQSILRIQCIVGLHPLIVPQAFPSTCSTLFDKGSSGQQSTPMLCVMSHKEDSKWDAWFEWVERNATSEWYILSDRPTPLQRLWLNKNAIQLRQFEKGSYILLEKQAWKRANHRNRRSPTLWELWGKKGDQDLQDIISNLQAIKITKDGRLEDREWLAEDLHFGPAASLYTDDCVVIATDGSVQQDGSMGAAATSLSDSIPERMQGVGGNPSSTLAELSALQLAAEMVLERSNVKNAIILTDSLTSLTILEDRQRQDFRSTRWHDDEIAVTSDKLIDTLNSCASNGQTLQLQKIKAHALEPLNERADELAERATGLPPAELPRDQFRCLLTLPDQKPRSWSSSLAKALVQIVAEHSLGKTLNKPMEEIFVHRHPSSRRDVTVTTATKDLPKSSQWLLWKRAGREKLGSILRSKRYDKQHKVITQAMANSFPTQANLHIWNKAPTASCPLGCPENETFAHLQCYCTKLKAQRIAVHHKIWTSTTSMVQKCLPHDKFTFVQEASIPKILAAIDNARQSSGDKEVLRQSIGNIDWHHQQESPTEQNIAHGVQALSRITDCAVLPSTVKRPCPQQGDRCTKKGRSQPIENPRLKRNIEPDPDPRWVSVKCPKRREATSTASPSSQQPLQQPQPTRKPASKEPRRRNRPIDRPFFPSLTNPSPTNYLSLVNRSQLVGHPPGGNRGEEPTTVDPADKRTMLPVPDIGRQRPDGALINWRKKRIHILEFTRPYDSRRMSLAKTNLYKLLKYEPLHRKISNALPAPWTASVVAFAIGVRGTADEPAWKAALQHLGIYSRRHHDQIIKAAISSSLDAIYEMTEARQAAVRSGHHSMVGDATPPSVTRSRK